MWHFYQPAERSVEAEWDSKGKHEEADADLLLITIT